MKTSLLIPATVFLSLAGLASSLHADGKTAPVPVAPPAAPSTTVIEETTRVAVLPDPALDKLEGKIDRIDGEKKQLMLRTKQGKEPLAYHCNAATKYVDLDGIPVNPVLLIPETPVEVRFVEDRNELIASTVVVQRIQVPLPGGGVTLSTRETLKPGGKVVAESIKKTTIVTGSGTISKVEPGFFTLTPGGEAHPQRYQYSETTTWVNAAGEPVPVTILKAGYPVKVSYTPHGDTLFADEVVVMVPPASPAPRTKQTPPKK